MPDTDRGIVPDDSDWSSAGLDASEALQRWQAWTSRAMAPIDIEIADKKSFAAHVRNYAVGPLNLATFTASAQRVFHLADGNSRGLDHFQLVYSRKSPFTTRIGVNCFPVKEGQFVLIDNMHPYEMEMDRTHEAITLLMPRQWLEKWLPDPARCAGQSISASDSWGLPLGCFLSAAASNIDDAALPRSMIADQIGPLIALAVGRQPVVGSKHKAQIVKRLHRIVSEQYGNTDLCATGVARELGISKRYLHALLADSGTTFISVLNGIRLERASAMIADRRFIGLHISEISWRCGYLDPSYFARLFRRQFGKGPREWRRERCQ